MSQRDDRQTVCLFVWRKDRREISNRRRVSGAAMNDFSKVLYFLLDAAARGERTALVTITDVVGSSPRAPGSHMAITETGDRVGSVSGGCVEAAVVAEAIRCIKSGRTEKIRLGQGSRFIDIRLPCGGGMDILFTPEPSEDVLADALRLHEERRWLALALDPDGTVALVDQDESETGWRDGVFFAAHAPRLKLSIFGRGAEVECLARLALVSGIEIGVGSPDQSLVESLGSICAEVHHLKTSSGDLGFSIDPRTAVILLFHDPDWELDLLDQVLRYPTFFIGAMGSRRTHARRLKDLRLRGFNDVDLERIIGPVGLIPSARDPQTLALSVLAQVVACYKTFQLCHRDAPAKERKAPLNAANI
jgi:xanthine dehydrogenase accessory factor